MLIIERGSKYYRPYSVEVNGVVRSVKSIIVYEDNDILFETSSGWFQDIKSHYQDLEKLTLDTEKEIKLKRKLKFDGNIFVMTREEAYSRDKLWTLYIPNSIAKFKKIKRYLKHTSVVDLYESETLGASENVYRNDLRIDKRLNQIEHEFREIKESYDFRIEEDITEHLTRLKELREERIKELEKIGGLDLDSL